MVAKKRRSSVIKNDPFEALDESCDEATDVAAEETVKQKNKAKAKPKKKTKSKPKTEAVKEPEVESVMVAEACSNSNQINLGDSLGIQNVGQIMADIGAAFDLGTPIELNGEDVERIDGAGLQLLCMLMKSAGEKGVQIGWNSPSETLVEGAKQLGLQDLLQLNR